MVQARVAEITHQTKSFLSLGGTSKYTLYRNLDLNQLNVVILTVFAGFDLVRFFASNMWIRQRHNYVFKRINVFNSIQDGDDGAKQKQFLNKFFDHYT